MILGRLNFVFKEKRNERADSSILKFVSYIITNLKKSEMSIEFKMNIFDRKYKGERECRIP